MSFSARGSYAKVAFILAEQKLDITEQESAIFDENFIAGINSAIDDGLFSDVDADTMIQDLEDKIVSIPINDKELSDFEEFMHEEVSESKKEADPGLETFNDADFQDLFIEANYAELIGMFNSPSVAKPKKSVEIDLLTGRETDEYEPGSLGIS
jgi:hypothetical protein